MKQKEDIIKACVHAIVSGKQFGPIWLIDDGGYIHLTEAFHTKSHSEVRQNLKYAITESPEAFAMFSIELVSDAIKYKEMSVRLWNPSAGSYDII